MKRTGFALSIVLGMVLLFSCSFAQEITILYTGQTHAMLYTCSCPKQPDGGVARRATLIKQIKQNNPNTLVLDSGAFFAGGLLDEFTQNTELDMQRTLINIKAMEKMKYDAVAISADEFDFGKDFFDQTLDQSKLDFLSCNLQSDKVKPFIIKEVAGVKVGVIGLTSLAALQKAGSGIRLIEPKIALRETMEKIKREGAQIIILLSNLQENENLNLAQEIPGIDIIIMGMSQEKQEQPVTINSTFMVSSFWQGRRLGKLSFVYKDKKISDYKLEFLRLSDQVSDDRDVSAIVPDCFSDANCKKEGMVGICQEPGTKKARCLFAEATKIPLTVITPKSCIACNPERFITALKKTFAGLEVKYIYYPSPQANELIEKFSLKGLPAYLFGKEIQKEKSFDLFKRNIQEKDNYYLLDPRASGVSYLLKREPIKEKFDLFISLQDKGAVSLLGIASEFNPKIHFLAVKAKDGFSAAKGNLEVEEYLRSVCVQKYYPQAFWDYISCRSSNFETSWWQDCLLNGDAQKIAICAKGEEGTRLLEENISLNKELEIMFGPTYLVDNQEIFASQGLPTREELKKMLKR